MVGQPDLTLSLLSLSLPPAADCCARNLCSRFGMCSFLSLPPVLVPSPSVAFVSPVAAVRVLTSL